MRLLVDRLPSPIGNNFVVWDERGIVRAVDFEDFEGRMRQLLQKHYGRVDLIPDRLPKKISGKLEAYFDGDFIALDTIQVETRGTRFQQDAWSALRAIPAGETRSYRQQAGMIGNPKACRAVGGANRVNPIPIIVPCHRVIGNSGELTGYGGGLARKHWLLKHERQNCRQTVS